MLGQRGCFSFLLLRVGGKEYICVKTTMQKTNPLKTESPFTYIHLNATEPDELCTVL